MIANDKIKIVLMKRKPLSWYIFCENFSFMHSRFLSFVGQIIFSSEYINSMEAEVFKDCQFEKGIIVCIVSFSLIPTSRFVVFLILLVEVS